MNYVLKKVLFFDRLRPRRRCKRFFPTKILSTSTWETSVLKEKNARYTICLLVNLCIQALQGYIAHDGEGEESGGEEDKEEGGGGGGGGGGEEGDILWDLHSALDLLLIKHPHLKEASSKIFCACHTLDHLEFAVVYFFSTEVAPTPSDRRQGGSHRKLHQCKWDFVGCSDMGKL